jgi:acid stress-induced BolA-like protein IbaG/YrbA
VSLQILDSPSKPDDLAQELTAAITSALPNAEVAVRATGAGHFEIRVVSQTFDGQSRVAQQQSVYAAIAHMMKGDAAPVHAIDKLETRSP